MAPFDLGPWQTEVRAKKHPDAIGGLNVVSIDPSQIEDLAFVPGLDGGVRTLTLRDLQHTYVYREVLPDRLEANSTTSRFNGKLSYGRVLCTPAVAAPNCM